MAKYNINNLTDTEDIINKIINQIDKINTKIKTFKNEGITEHYIFVTESIGDNRVLYNSNGNISKSKKFYKDKNILELKSTLANLREINNNSVYGTVRKYNNQLHDNVKRLQKYVSKSLKDKGYSDEFIKKVVNKSSFYDNLITAFNTYKETDSDQIVDSLVKVFEDNMQITKDQAKKYINSIEFSNSMQDTILTEQQEYLEYKNMMKDRNRKRR